MQTASGTSVNQPVSQYGAANLVLGDLLQFDTEQFYYIGTEGNNLKLLSRYLLNVGENRNTNLTEGLQSANIGYTVGRFEEALEEMDGFPSYSGSLPFSTSLYWWDEEANDFEGDYISPYTQDSFIYNSSSALYQYISGPNGYVYTLSGMGLNVTSGTVLSVQEIGAICNNTDFTIDNSDTSGCPSFVFETSYWLGNAGIQEAIWSVYADGIVYYIPALDAIEDGVRPVINVSLS